jgi:hypothetical protein
MANRSNRDPDEPAGASPDDMEQIRGVGEQDDEFDDTDDMDEEEDNEEEENSTF